jgi:hypothetical protein
MIIARLAVSVWRPVPATPGILAYQVLVQRHLLPAAATRILG